jgi:hypothetical protein
MPTKVYWIDEPWIMSADYIGGISVQDIDDVMEKCLAYLEKQEIYFLVDTTQMTSLPPNVFKVKSLAKLINHSNTRWLVMTAGDNPLLKFVIQVMIRNRIKVVNNREEGLQFLRDLVAANIQIGEHESNPA